jgi:hypothetical protein
LWGVNLEDGKTISIDPSEVSTTVDMLQTFERHSRALKVQEDIADA